MKILVFIEGTILMHASGKGKTREEIVQQSREFGIQMEERNISYEDKGSYGIDPGNIHDCAGYIPVLNAVEKIKGWKDQGAEIYYLSSRRTRRELEAIKSVLQKYNFPDSQNFLFRQQGEDYKDVADKLLPDILVEDDCESIGGKDEMTYTHLSPRVKSQVHSIPIKEFGGIDHLLDELDQLIKF